MLGNDTLHKIWAKELFYNVEVSPSPSSADSENMGSPERANVSNGASPVDANSRRSPLQDLTLETATNLIRNINYAD